MSEYTTLIRKSCGHCGLVRSKFPQSVISCSQCALDEKDLEKSRVQVVERKFVPSKEIPDLEFKEMNDWIKKKLGDR